MEFNVIHTDRTGANRTTTTVVVRESTDHTGAPCFYAFGGKWGCGKNAPNPRAAVRLLVQDMARIESIDPAGQ